MANVPFLLSFDSAPSFYNHDIYPNRIYRRLHPRQHEPLDIHTMGLMARLGAHAHQLGAKRNGELTVLPRAGSIKDGAFEVNLDVGLFLPDELSVKVVDNFVVVEGKHEEREDEHGHISRHLVRRYALPKGFEGDKVEAEVTPDGVLTVRAPKPALLENSHERIVPIHRTGPSDLFLKSASKDEAEGAKEQQK